MEKNIVKMFQRNGLQQQGHALRSDDDDCVKNVLV